MLNQQEGKDQDQEALNSRIAHPTHLVEVVIALVQTLLVLLRHGHP